MSDITPRWHLFNRTSRPPELMDRMMERLVVSSAEAARVDGGMAWYAARTKCIFCRCERECRNWLEDPDTLPGPEGFCPNVDLFRMVQRSNAHHHFVSSPSRAA